MPVCLPFPFHADALAPRVRPRSRGRPISYTSPDLMRRAPARRPFALFSLLRARSRARRRPSRYNVSQGASPPSRAAPRESPRAFRNGAEARTTARSIFRAKGPRPSMRPARPGLRWRYGNARRVDAARPRKGRMSPPRERPTTPPPRKMYPVPSNDAPSMRRPMSHPSVKLPSHALYQMIAPDINAGT